MTYEQIVAANVIAHYIYADARARQAAAETTDPLQSARQQPGAPDNRATETVPGPGAFPGPNRQ